jgi:hypothetical protein
MNNIFNGLLNITKRGTTIGTAINTLITSNKKNKNSKKDKTDKKDKKDKTISDDTGGDTGGNITNDKITNNEYNDGSIKPAKQLNVNDNKPTLKSIIEIPTQEYKYGGNKRKYPDYDDLSNDCGGNADKKYKKDNIPKRIREFVWTTYNGETYKNKCYVSWCDNIINVFNFQVGHDIPESKGGTLEISNLKPICGNCNQSMGNKYTITEWCKLINLHNHR